MAPSSLLLFDERKGTRLAETFAPCFMLILQLRTSREFGDPDLLRRRIKDLLEQARRDAVVAGVTPEEYRLASFAVVAFLDETILSSDWSLKDHWVARPLQLELFERFDAGEQFFVYLDELRGQPAENAEMLEVYYLCMALGFKGQYQIHGQEQYRTLIEETYGTLTRVSGFGDGPLSPHGAPRSAVTEAARRPVPAWAIVATVAAVALVVYLALFFSVSHTAESTAAEIQQMVRIP